jgi:hypothetical protein
MKYQKKEVNIYYFELRKIIMQRILKPQLF